MTQTANEKFVPSLVALLAIVLGSAAARADAPSIVGVLQPQGLKHTGIYALKQIDPTLTGTGVKFAVVCRSFTYIDDKPQNDFRPAVEHDCFKTRQFGFWEDAGLPAGISPHSTASCSILLGEDPDAFHPKIGPFYYQGAAPQAEADVYEFLYFLVNNVLSHTAPDADVIVASWGSQFEDWWTRGIESLVEHYGTIVVASIGNGGEPRGPVLYPGAGANVIGVGVVDSVNTSDPLINLANFALAYPEHSSYGPTGTGRCKPDLVAPGNCLAADVTEPNRYEPVGNWSSFSTPVVAGTVGLLLQKARQDPELDAAASPDGGNCVMKAILLNSATKLPYWHKGRLQTDDDHSAVLDYIQGAGMLNAVGAYNQLVAGMSKPGEAPATGWDLNLLDKRRAPQNSYTVTLTEPADKIITITLAWNRHYASVSPFKPIPGKDSNLRLELWAIDPVDQGNDYLLDYSDSSVDNLEHIYAAADPDYNVYRIVLAFSDNENQQESASNQRYGLAWNVSNTPPNDSIFWYDLNADGIVNELDFAIVLDNLADSATSPESYLFGDITADGSIDVRDVEDLFKHDNRRADWYVEPDVELR
ncbi:MAG TPA: S8 family serine peptidase [Sedimentisphaerales bacterium]|nr:S8 family serine peptidase [Sedimentisphaerales bacterium]